MFSIDRDSRRDLEVLLAIAVIAALVVLLYRNTFVSMAQIWRFSEYRHGALVPPITAYLLWRLRRPLATIELRPSVWAIAPLAGLVFVWIVARAVGVQAIEHLVVVLLIPAAVWALLGFRLLERALFPLLFLVAAVPVGDALLPWLMELTADVSSSLLEIAGVPVYRQGQLLALPGGDFEIADVCAGLSYLTAGTMIALLFAYFAYASNVKRASFVAAMAAVVVAANGVRAFIVMYVASATKLEYLAGRDHVYFGWALFALVISAMLYGGARFADRPARAGQAEHETSSTDARRATPYRSFAGAVTLVVGIAVLAAGPWLSIGRARTGHATLPTALLPATAECGEPEAWSASWRPELHGADGVWSGTYRCMGRPVHVFVGTYLDNEQERELVSTTNRLMPSGWRNRSVTDVRELDAHDGRRLRFNEVRLDTAGERSVVWYWYTVGGRTATSPLAVKLRQMQQLVVEGRADGSVLLLYTPHDADIESVRRRLAAIAAAVDAKLRDVVGREADRDGAAYEPKVTANRTEER